MTIATTQPHRVVHGRSGLNLLADYRLTELDPGEPRDTIMITGREIARWEGGVFLAYYTAYTAWLVLQAQQHASVPAFSGIMLGYVMPLTVITIVVSIVRSNGRRA